MSISPSDPDRRGRPEWLLLASVLLGGAIAVTIVNRWPAIGALQMLELLFGAVVYLAYTLAGEHYLARFGSLPVRAGYFVVQIVLASAVLYLIARLGVIGSAVFVFVPVLGQAVSLLRWPAGPAAITAICLVVFLAVLRTEMGPGTLVEAAIGYLLMAGFIILMTRNVMREREARYQAQALADQLQAYVERSSPKPEPANLAEPLTAREMQVLDCVCRGMSNKAIAEALHLAEGTVKNHMTSVLGKLGVRDRTQAALKARDFDLV